MTDPTPIDLVEGQLEAYNARDLDRFIAHYSPDVRVHRLPEGIVMQGHEAMTERYGRMFADSPQLHCRIVSRMQFGDWVVDEESITGHPSNPAGVVRAVAIYRSERGLIVEVYFLA